MDVPLHAALQLAHLVMIMVLQSYCIFYSCVPVPVARRRISDSNVDTRYRWGEIPPFSYDIIPLAVKPLNKFKDKENEEQ
jgi:hypothetical protein